MTKLVVLKLDGDFTTGFKVNVEIFLEDKSFDGRKSGKLPAAIKLLECLDFWQLEYRALGTNQRIKGKKVIFTSGNSRSKLNLWGEKLRDRFQYWLRAKSFQDVNLWLREKLNIQDSIRVLLCTDNQKVHQLPWSQWDFIQHYPYAEIALSRLDVVEVSPSFGKQKSQIRILAIFGSSENIDVEEDLKILSTYKNVDLKSLVQPQREELYDCLWLERWDIVFFAGHSETIAEKGIIYLNKQDTLTISNLEYAFQRAIANGLQLAIFNSCDGLGLAYALGKLGLPQIIVMREPIIDRVAHQFLSYFLTEYSSNQPLHLATRKARERLQREEQKYPFSSWLPVLYQNQSATPPLWFQLMGVANSRFVKRTKYDYYQFFLLIAISTCLAWLGQTLGWLQGLELDNYDRALRLRPIEARDERILVITIDDLDIDYQYPEGSIRQGSLRDEALGQLLTKLQPHNPVAIASDIIHDFPYSQELKPIIARQNNFIAICRVKNKNSRLETIAAPPEIPLTQTGFTNIAIDNDGVIRRQILGMSADREKCQTDISLSLRMALKYLDYLAVKTQNQMVFPRRLQANQNLEIGRTIFAKIEFDSGAYQLPKTENQGYQILFNYRYRQPKTISLREILTENSEEKLSALVKEKLIFIGVKSHNSDLHYTPYSNGQQAARLPGVLIHAQATSQIISAVLDRRTIIKWFPQQIEFLWTTIWSTIGAGMFFFNSFLLAKKSHLLLIIITLISLSLALLYLSYFSLLILGYWLPLITPTLTFLLSATASLLIVKKRKKYLNINKKNSKLNLSVLSRSLNIKNIK